jgi:Mg2+ and Co2+ transporter CorA
MGLAYVAVDALVDRHLPAASQAAEHAEQFEDDLNPENELRSIPALERLIVLRRDLLAFRRIGVFQSEVLRRLGRKNADLRSYYSDVGDNEREAVETAAATCDYIDGAIEAFQVRRDARTELGIRRLTVLGVILGPMSLTIGLWSVSFANIPGTQLRWGWTTFVACHLAFMLLSIAYLRRARLL